MSWLKEVIRQWWQYITTQLKCDIVVLDMSLLNTASTDSSLDKRFVADLVLQILSYVSEKERLSIKERQRERVLSICGGCEFYLAKKNSKLDVEGFRAKCMNCKSLIQADIYQSDLIECFIDEHKGKGTVIAKRYGKTIEILYAEGRSPREIAKTLGISHTSVYRYLNSHN